MGISKVIVISADTKAAQKALKEVNLTIEQQEDLLKDTQRQIEKLEDLRNKTSKKDANRIIKYNDEIKKQNKNLKRTKTRLTENKQARSKANTELKNTVKNQRDYSGVLGVIDRINANCYNSNRNRCFGNCYNFSSNSINKFRSRSK